MGFLRHLRRPAAPEVPSPLALPIAGREIMELRISHYVPHLRLEFYGSTIDSPDKDAYTLLVDGKFSLESADGSAHLNPAEPSEGVLRLRSKHVQDALAYDDGSLVVHFADGDILQIPPDEYEPWQFTSAVTVDDEGWLVVSVAGGGLSVWMPDRT